MKYATVFLNHLKFFFNYWGFQSFDYERYSRNTPCALNHISTSSYIHNLLHYFFHVFDQIPYFGLIFVQFIASPVVSLI